jgi:hypothetical protein
VNAPLDRAFADVDALLADIGAWPDDERKATARSRCASP